MSDAPLGLGGDCSLAASLVLRFTEGQATRLRSLFNVKISAEIKAAISLRLPAAWRAGDAAGKLEKHPKIFPAHLGPWWDVSSMVGRCWHGALRWCQQPSQGDEWHLPCHRGQSRGILCLLESRVTDPLLPEPPSPTLCLDKRLRVPVWAHPSWSSDFAVTDPSPRSRSCFHLPKQGHPQGRRRGEGSPANCAGKQDFVNESTPSKNTRYFRFHETQQVGGS